MGRHLPLILLPRVAAQRNLTDRPGRVVADRNSEPGLLLDLRQSELFNYGKTAGDLLNEMHRKAVRTIRSHQPTNPLLRRIQKAYGLGTSTAKEKAALHDRRERGPLVRAKPTIQKSEH